MIKDENTNELKKKKWLRILLDKYVIVSLMFIVWMLFFDQNSYMIHRELDKQIKGLKKDKEVFSEKLKSETLKVNKMKSDTTEIERVAREKHFLKKDDEDVFIVEEQKVKREEIKKEDK